MKIAVETLDRIPVEKQKVEIVERKGIGHPDSVADGLAESVSRALCREYLQNFGYILHHNTDECQIVGGQSQPSFGGGVIIEPVYILLVGRATALFGNKRLPIRAIAVRAAHEYLEKNFRNLNADTDVIIDCKIWEGSQDLKSVYDPRRKLANDTSVGVGYAPLSETEKLTLQMERYININLRNSYPEVGEDVKVMSSRIEDKIGITVAIAMVDRHIPDADHYISVKEEIAEELLDFATKFTEKDVSLAINTADDYEKGVYYLTVTGLSMENGDDGSVGRGNRINGLITPNRPVSMEAAAGKNPVTHVGKLYNVTATRIAEDIVKNYEVEEAYVRMLSQIGKPVTDPIVVGISIVGGKIDSGVEEVVKERLEKISEIKDEVLAGKLKVF
ncbi:MAG TPA: methionine adenosyltransferase [Thermoplasmatales archaeon]|nr:methionine adenosyltransferase [Thermoplasmatales archaeon]